ncbi:MAG: tyrosine-type recombinase/integrase [Usitatibacter sp.]
MALLKDVAVLFMAAEDWDRATISRVSYWVEVFGEKDIAEITEDEADDAMAKLATRGRLKGGKLPTTATGKPLAGSTVNRYLAQIGSLYKFAKKHKLLRRGFVSPFMGIERHPEPADPERYLRPEEVDRVRAAARVLDKRWGKMEALIVVAYHTGLRAGALTNLKRKDVDLDEGTLFVKVTKNGDPITVSLSTDARKHMKRACRGLQPDERIFASRSGKPFNYDNLWDRLAKAAGLDGHVFHELRHGHGHQLSRKGASQHQIMQSMGHRTLSASARYAHANVDDKRAVIQRAFG